MSRRRTDRPVERLRSSWTSTADLEETIQAMFLPPALADKLTAKTTPEPPDKLTADTDVTAPAVANITSTTTDAAPDKLACADEALPPVNLSTVPGDKLTDPPTDKLAEAPPVNLPSAMPVNLSPAPPVNLADSPPDSLAARAPESGGISPPDNLAGPLYETMDGLVVDAKCIRPYDNVQSAHTASEHLVYMAMWKLLGSRDDDGPHREGILPMGAIVSKVSISLRNLRRVLRSLEQKLAVEVTEYEDKTRSIPRRYRVWGFRATIDRRRAAGYSYVYRNRNLITLARAHANPPIKLTGGAPANLTDAPPDRLAQGAPDRLAADPPVNQTPEPPDNLSAFLIKDLSKGGEATSLPVSVSPVVAKAVLQEFGLIDDNALQRMICGCREHVPDATDEEIAAFATAAAHRIRRMKNVANPVGLLITQVPRYFEGQSFLLYREENRLAQEARRRRLAQQRQEAQATLASPHSTKLDRDWARAVLRNPDPEA